MSSMCNSDHAKIKNIRELNKFLVRKYFSIELSHVEWMQQRKFVLIRRKKLELGRKPEILTVFSLAFSSEILACFSWYNFQRLSSINPSSRPKGVSRLSALSNRRRSRCSERLSMRRKNIFYQTNISNNQELYK